MQLRNLPVVVLLVLSSFVAYGVNPSRSELEAMYDKAFSAFDEARYDDALKALDAIDLNQPDLAESLNLRGVVYMRQGNFDRAETALRKALSLEPKFWNASFNLAEIPFLKKDWPEARNRFTALLAGGAGEGLQAETTQLIEYKIFLTFVMQGKEGTADWILNKFEGAKDSPALYYANAAVAFQHGNEKEAKDWMSAANKQFSEPLNKLYAESFYEVGWMKKPAGEARAALEITSTTERAARLKTEAKANLEKAERAFQQRDFEGALKSLDVAETAVPNDAEALNLRGEILLAQEKFEDAEGIFRKALAANPKFREAQYNLAQISFKKGEYAKARDRFEALFAETPGGEKNQAAQLIKYKIFMTLLLEEKEVAAQRLMDQFKFTGDTPALYYAQAAWEFKHGRAEQGNDWVTSARKIYSPALNMVFADSFYDLAWLEKPSDESAVPSSALAQADAPLAVEPTPAMRFGPSETVEPPAAVEPTGVTSAAVASETSTPATAPVAGASTSAPPAAAIGAQSTPAMAAAEPATTVLTPDQAQQWSRPTFAETVDRISNPRSLLVLLLLLAGILLLVWLVVQQFRRNLSNVPLYNPSEPLTDPPFDGDEPTTGNERRISRDHLSSGPPKVSLNLVGSEPSVRRAVLPSGAITGRGSAPGVEEPLTDLPNEGTGSVSEPVAQTVAPATPPLPPAAITPPAAKEGAPVGPEEAPEPLRDREEVSVAAAEEAPAPIHAVETPAVEPAPPAVPAAKIEEPAATIEEPVAKIEEPPAKIDEPVVAAEESAEKPEEPAEMVEEPVGQGQPIPHLTTAFSAEPVISEIAQPEPESELVLLEPDELVPAAFAGRQAQQSSIETPSFASKIITTEPIRLQPTTSDIMPETTITPASTARPSTPTMSVQQPVGGMHTAVQLTFSLEIASMQLTPTFKMSGLQLKPTSKVVSMRLAPSQDPQPPMNLQVTFEVAKIELNNGAIGTVRLAPSAQQKPAVLNSPSFAISGLELVSGQGAAPVQLTPSHQEQASVHLTAEFQIAAIEFTPLFEIATIVLNSTSKKVSMQLPGSGPSSIDTAPVFDVSSVQLGAGNELGLIQVVPGA